MSKYIARSIILVLFFTLSTAYAGPLDDCKEYTKYGISDHKGDILCRKGYLLAHDPKRKTPIWVAEHLTHERASASLDRSDDFRPDPDLKKDSRAELSDYKDSGYDRGHMAPAGDMRWDEQAMSESFYLSNMIPQVGVGMNRGIWKDLEEKVRLWALERMELYIYTGPIYAEGNKSKTIGGNKVGVPSHIYKIIFDPVKVEAIAYIMPNKKLNSKDMPNYVVSVREVEKKTGLNFLSILNQSVQDMVEAEKAVGGWK